MTRRFLMTMVFAALVVSPTWAQTPAPSQAQRPAPPATVAEAQAQLWANAVRRWEALGGKLVAMARQFPGEKAHFKFHPDVRSFLEEIWHETFDQQMLEARLKGPEVLKALDTKKLFSGEGRPTDLARAADELETVLASVSGMLKASPRIDTIPNLDFYIEHLAVAYGKLAAMYRANGLVPPVTAQAQKKAAGGGSSAPRD